MKAIHPSFLLVAASIACMAVGCATGGEDKFNGTTGGGAGSDAPNGNDDGDGAESTGGGGTGGNPEGGGDEETAPNNCGNGILDPGEKCDTDKLDDQTCLSLNFGPGDLSCSATCEFDTSKCTECASTNLGTWNGTPIHKSDQSTCGGSTNYDGNECTSVHSQGKEQVYSITVPANKSVDIAITTDPSFEASAWVSTSCANYNAVGCVAGTDVAGSKKLKIANNSESSATYFIVVDGNDPENCGGFSISIGAEMPPEWVCDSSLYFAQNGCDCGCGAIDPDCVDGNSSTCDNCSNPGSCATECEDLEPAKNWLCKPPPDCGNGVINDGEECDGEKFGTATCITKGFKAGNLICTAECKIDTSGCTNCGNGIAEGAEECDGTDLKSQTCESKSFSGGSLSCKSDCTLNTSACSVCGNDIVEPGEACDGTKVGTETCIKGGYKSGTLKCSADCKSLDYSNCSSCGNMIVEGDEDCEAGVPVTQTCESVGLGRGTLTCNTGTCKFNISGCSTCGNGKLDGTEQCDGAVIGTATCESILGKGVTGTIGCNPNCTFDLSKCDTCGNGTVELADECDGTDLNGKLCRSLGFDKGALSCNSATCKFDTSLCSKCGDEIVGFAEDCDGSNLNGQSCASLGIGSGTLSCYANCSFNTTDCSAAPPGWTCAASEYSDGVCDCGCGIPDPACGTLGCASKDCSAPGCQWCHSNTGTYNKNDCSGGTWTCSAGWFFDTICDCNCGLPDPACIPGQCDEIPPDVWTCNPSEYGDGICDCGCGIADPDCKGNGCTTEACTAPGCTYCHSPKSSNYKKNYCGSGQWLCPASFFFDSVCDCGCGMPDPACSGDAYHCAHPGCSVDGCSYCFDGSSSTSGNCTTKWNPNCSIWYYDDGNVCDCGCDRPDPDCAGGGCTTPGCSNPDCFWTNTKP
ncbi:MAG: hypothetical protein FWD57_02910 [Polyangiaceae bacterium]|nr:hypothetical protein [Polyangiaceae bacterium]